MVRRASVRLLAPVAVFFVARTWLGNGDALLIAALVYGLVEARHRCSAAPAVKPKDRKWPSASAMRAKA
jgi:hypothetical protein